MREIRQEEQIIEQQVSYSFGFAAKGTIGFSVYECVSVLCLWKFHYCYTPIENEIWIRESIVREHCTSC